MSKGTLICDSSILLSNPVSRLSKSFGALAFPEHLWQAAISFCLITSSDGKLILSSAALSGLFFC